MSIANFSSLLYIYIGYETKSQGITNTEQIRKISCYPFQHISSKRLYKDLTYTISPMMKP